MRILQSVHSSSSDSCFLPMVGVHHCQIVQGSSSDTGRQSFGRAYPIKLNALSTCHAEQGLDKEKITALDHIMGESATFTSHHGTLADMLSMGGWSRKCSALLCNCRHQQINMLGHCSMLRCAQHVWVFFNVGGRGSMESPGRTPPPQNKSQLTPTPPNPTATDPLDSRGHPDPRIRKNSHCSFGISVCWGPKKN